MNFRDENESTSLSASYTGHFVFVEEGTESSLEYFKVSYNFKIWIINSDSKSWSALSFVYFMTFYKLQNFLKSPPRMQEMACQGLHISKCSRGACPRTLYRFLAPLVLGPQAKTKLYAYLHADWLEYMRRDESTWKLMRVHVFGKSLVLLHHWFIST